jgi:hypothetical protein
MAELDATRTAEDDRVEKRDEAYAIALQELEQQQQRDERTVADRQKAFEADAARTEQKSTSKK